MQDLSEYIKELLTKQIRNFKKKTTQRLLGFNLWKLDIKGNITIMVISWKSEVLFPHFYRRSEVQGSSAGNFPPFPTRMTLFWGSIRCCCGLVVGVVLKVRRILGSDEHWIIDCLCSFWLLVKNQSGRKDENHIQGKLWELLFVSHFSGREIE